MTQEDKQLLLQDLSARLPYGIHLFTNSKHHIRLLTISRDLDYDEQYWINGLYDVDEIKPYLRPMSSMTEEEKAELNAITDEFGDNWLEAATPEERWKCTFLNSSNEIDWLNKHHFDYRGLIEKGLALEALEDMYKIG